MPSILSVLQLKLNHDRYQLHHVNNISHLQLRLRSRRLLRLPSPCRLLLLFFGSGAGSEVFGPGGVEAVESPGRRPPQAKNLKKLICRQGTCTYTNAAKEPRGGRGTILAPASKHRRRYVTISDSIFTPLGNATVDGADVAGGGSATAPAFAAGEDGVPRGGTAGSGGREAPGLGRSSVLPETRS